MSADPSQPPSSPKNGAEPYNNTADIADDLQPEQRKRTCDCLKRLRHRGRVFWSAVCRWFVVNTFAPGWLPRPLRHPFVGYLLSVLLSSAVAALELFVITYSPEFAFQRLPFVLVVVVMALYWGMGPSLVAGCWSAFLIYYVKRPPHFTWMLGDLQDIVGVVLFLFVAFAIAILASREERLRRKAEERSAALRVEGRRVQQEWERTQANELALQQASQQTEAFLSMASHELKTPLTTVILGLQLVQRRLQGLLTPDTIESADLHKRIEGLLEYMRRVDSQASRLDRLVNDLLDVSRIEEGKLELHLQPTDLVPLIRKVVEEHHQAIPERAITLHLRAVQYMPVLVDRDRIGQVMLNYLTNALKYSAEDRPVEIGIEMEDWVARVWVRDAGPGIPSEEQERVWERFHRVPGIEVQSGSGIGLGLGLHISRTIIERHRGHVGVESTPGVGATFWFTLPLVGGASP